MEKIRPQPKPSPFKAQDEADLPGVARAPDIGGRVTLEDLGDTMSAASIAAQRAGMSAPNALGKPFKPSQAELLLADYQAKRVAWKEAYAKVRADNTPEELEYFDAKRACIAAGLLPADS